MGTHRWSASLICANLLQLQEQLTLLEEYEVDFLHVDVMDGRFVPRFGMYPEMVQAVKSHCSIPIEVHLMVENPDPYIEVFCLAGADILTIHLESCRSHLLKTVEQIQSYEVQVGIALNPASRLEEIEEILAEVDYLLLMGINPGILGQKIKPFMFEKIKKAHHLLVQRKYPTKISIDGGVNFENEEALFEAGADILIGGSQTIFHPGSSLSDNLARLKQKGYVLS